MAKTASANVPFDNRKELDPFNPNVQHTAPGLLVPGGGKLITYRLKNPPNPTFVETTDATWLIQGIDWIALERVNGHTYDYSIQIFGGAPGTDWDLKLEFVDETGDVYVKRLYSHTHSIHTIDYNSSSPNIKQINWYY